MCTCIVIHQCIGADEIEENYTVIIQTGNKAVAKMVIDSFPIVETKVQLWQESVPGKTNYHCEDK